MREKVALEFLGAMRPSQAVPNDPHEVRGNDDPVERLHYENARPNAQSAAITSTSTTTTWMYVRVTRGLYPGR